MSKSKYGDQRKQELTFLELVEKWTSKVQFDLSGDEPKLKFSDGKDRLPCDTLYNCKRDIIQHLSKEKNTLRNFKCAICRDYLYTENYNLYGEDEKTEKSPFGRDNAVKRQTISRLDYKYGYVRNRDDRKKPSPPDCPANVEISDDKFVLPCCQPLKQNGIIKIIDPNNANDLKSVENENEDLPCCGGGPSCCRWCPETLCDSLEKANEVLSKLWWHVCSGSDVNPSYDGFGKSNLGSSNPGKIPGEVKPEEKPRKE
jgi:hypothetical protein